MKKIVINACYGGFSLSPRALKRYAELAGRECFFFTSNLSTRAYKPVNVDDLDDEWFFSSFDTPHPNEEVTNENYRQNNIDPQERDDPVLIQVVEELGSGANGRCANLKIVEIPDDVEWEIEEYDGNEWVAEKHRTWQ